VRTPLEEQTAATVGLQRLTRIIVRNGGHDLFEADPRISSIVAAFFGGKTVNAVPLTIALPVAEQAK
jgi:hypothetical protein